ncbi:hypothetical protein WD019_04580 [Fictibacillus sp. Mic-4]|uniref:hypothetical protein n=1 Tax=Fictibacillus sp. Mic-4 TaxID=3132826 RepID=UPI003CEF77C2
MPRHTGTLREIDREKENIPDYLLRRDRYPEWAKELMKELDILPKRQPCRNNRNKRYKRSFRNYENKTRRNHV